VGASKTCCRFIDGLFTPGLEELPTETHPAYRPVLSQNPAPSRICTKGMNTVLSQDDKAVSMQSEAPLTLILSPLRAGRGEVERRFQGDARASLPRLPRMATYLDSQLAFKAFL